VATPKDYHRQISDLGLDKLTISASSAAEAKASMTPVRSLQQQLRQIKRYIDQDMKTIRAEYRDKSSTAASSSSSLLSAFGKRKLAGQVRADAKRRLSAQRDQQLKPYENLKLTIDDVLFQLDSAKLQLSDYIQEATAEKQAERTVGGGAKPTAFCPECGNEVDPSDKFCPLCGRKLN